MPCQPKCEPVALEGGNIKREPMTRIVASAVAAIPGTAKALPDVMTGRVSIIIDGTAGLLGVVKGGDLRAIAVASEKPLLEFPELATVAETIPGLVSTGWPCW